ncbi:hypothetical protein, conserved [Eimeria tenella]|uniref:Uncharacterized protein n=1 Tax=Eimeria tenella TaxID=5802 RepID=U6KPG5_EIMTE|nr:hypothetical protein, conserved [Eimeria tenella]CDJ39987.1 hypothetical protein, conserved [Eimeria tenella]|eukprot:XP_013230740.1 hypothetical protein, conserved [Eimeria tenella]
MDARKLGSSVAVPLFYRPGLSVQRRGRAVLPLCFELRDLIRTWAAASSSSSSSSSSEGGSGSSSGEDGQVMVLDLLDLLLRAALQQQASPTRTDSALAQQRQQQQQQQQQQESLAELIDSGLWGLVPSSEALQQVQMMRARGVRKAQLHLSPDD